MNNDNDRAAKINIGGQDYELLLTTRATKAIAAKYGGLENLGDKLMKAENFALALDEIIWLITLLANQSVLLWNLKNPQEKRDLLTEDAVEILTTPFDLAGFKAAITECMFRGTKRNIVSEDAEDNGANDNRKNVTGE